MMGTDALAVAEWAQHFEALCGRIAGCFSRRDLRGRAGVYLRGLLDPVQRKNGWQLDEHLGDVTPYGASVCWIGPVGMPTRCEMRSTATRVSTSWPTEKAGC